MDMTAMRGPTKLADVLKRSGLAASVNDAKRIASDISTTERKVQTYFDQKKGEMQDDLATKSRNIYVEKPEIKEESSVQELEIQKEPEMEKVDMGKKLQEVQDEVRMHLEKNNMVPKFEEKKEVLASESSNKSEEICSHCQRIKENNQTPVLKDLSAAEKEESEHISLHEMFKEEDQGQEYIYSKLDEENQLPNTDQQELNSFVDSETMVKPSETMSNSNSTNSITNVVKPNETIENISSPITEVKMEVIEETPVKPPMENKIEVIEEEPMEPKYKENKISEVPVEPVPEEKQMDVSEEQKIDLTQMFNFGSGSSKIAAPIPKQEAKVEEISETKDGKLGIKTNDSNNHPKTGNSESIDINEMFNFAKRGKI